eukprot:TRINITY_DN67828_c0_g1_i1.p1 TRINITY_DN67828_c0_g1~~TRINITY_DN67828_c0_g1_i1.p1  ORF type:complete len:204 (-),score=28.42 TRINITY_DN67828_c0_g1_i1:274-885(-)
MSVGIERRDGVPPLESAYLEDAEMLALCDAFEDAKQAAGSRTDVACAKFRSVAVSDYSAPSAPLTRRHSFSYVTQAHSHLVFECFETVAGASRASRSTSAQRHASFAGQALGIEGDVESTDTDAVCRSADGLAAPQDGITSSTSASSSNGGFRECSNFEAEIQGQVRFADLVHEDMLSYALLELVEDALEHVNNTFWRIAACT